MDQAPNLTLLWPWALLLWPLPWILHRLLPGQGRGEALRLPQSAAQPAQESESASPWVRLKTQWRFALIWSLLILATARPVLLDRLQTLPQNSRQVMLAVDISGSMNERLDHGTRLEQVQKVVGQFVMRREYDQVGLMVFGSHAYLYVPMTLDHTLLVEQLKALKAGMAGNGTAIGDAIGLGVRALRRGQGEAVLVVLSDGVTNAGQLTPAEALKIAQEAEIRTHLVLIGLETTPDLRERIQATGGQVFHANNVRSLDSIYQQIDKLEPVTQLKTLARHDPLAQYLLLLALLLSSYWLWQRRTPRPVDQHPEQVPGEQGKSAPEPSDQAHLRQPNE